MRRVALISVVLLATACSSPMDQVPRLSEAGLAGDAPSLSAVPQPEAAEAGTGGLFARLFARDKAEPETDAPDMVLAGEPEGEVALPADQPPDMPIASTDIATAAETLPVAAVGAEKKRGLLGFLRGQSRSKPEPATTPETAQIIPAGLPVAVDDATLSPEELGVASELPETPQSDLVEPKKRRGLFAAKPAAAVSSETPPGTVLPYGVVARQCDVPARKMGKKIAQFPERRAKHVLYDSDPGNTGPHTFYLTGFDDGCARQFTASLAVFGSVEMHEQLRYGLPSEVQPYSETDKAYEVIKRKICGVPRKKPCGAKIDRLNSDTVFLSIYERFGGNARWSNLLLHDGTLLAHDTKGG